MAICDGCGAEIKFAVNAKTEKRVPVNPEAKLRRLWVVEPDKEQKDPRSTRVRLVTIKGYEGHHWTCPKAASFRRRRR